MDELEEEMQSAVQRIITSLKSDGWQDVRWDPDVETITLFDPESQHTISLAPDWG